MSDVAISVRGLGKQYTLRASGASAPYQTLREAIRRGLSRPFRRRDPRGELFWALKDVSFEVDRGQVLGIIGRNGAGKSTLLKLLSRITVPTEGEADVHGQVGSLLEVGTGFHPELSGRENTYLNGAILGMTRREIARKFDEIVAFAEVERFIDTPVKFYSSGMYVRLAFAVAAHLDPELLIVDEVLAVGDAEFQKKCLGKLGEVATGGRTVLFVSHNMAAVRNLCSRVMMLASGRVTFDGGPDAGVEQYALAGTAGAAGAEPYIVYIAPGGSVRPAPEVEIWRIDLIGPDDQPLTNVRTWSNLRFRLHYRVTTPVRNAHFCVDLTDGYGRKLLSLETRTHTGRDDLGLADGVIECHVPQLPLAPGAYALGAAVFVPDQRAIWTGDRLGILTVHSDDVFGRGHLPPSSHAAIITPHDWVCGVG